MYFLLLLTINNNVSQREIDGKQLKTIKRLTANVKEMETRAQCWINRNVRDKFELKINHLEQLVDKLKTDKQLLSHEYNKTTANFRYYSRTLFIIDILNRE